MMKLFPLALGLLLMAPVAAQRMGSTNANAPTISASIEYASGVKVSCEYLAITWAQGRTMGALMDDSERGQRTRKRINDSAPEQPLGEFSTSTDLKVGDKVLAAGEYKIYFTITEKREWQINFGGEKDTVTITLPLQDSPMESKRLLLGLYAAEGEAAGLYVAFGKQSGDLAIMPHKAKDGDKKGDH